MKKVTLLIIISISSIFAIAQQTELEKAMITIKERGEVYFSFQESDRSVLTSLSSSLSMDKITGNEIIAYANANEFNKFLSHSIDFKVLTPPSMMFPSILENSRKERELNTWDYYPNWDEYNAMMNQFAANYPDLCELVTIGTSMNGREIMCIHINNNLGEDQNEPEFLYTSSIHGDELVGYVLSLRLIDYLLSNYGVLGDVTHMVDNIDIWINPLANPDGTFAGGNNSVWGATRGNANNIDCNRNFPDPEDGEHPDGNPWQTETIVWMDFAEDMDFVMSSNMHGGAEVVNYPWDTWSMLHTDTDWWELVSREYADQVHEHGWSGYFTDLDNGVTNGYAWYSISGGRQDYMNYFHNCREMTLELSAVKTPMESQLNDFWEANYRSLLSYMGQVLYGFSGVVTNAVNGNPVVAKVWIENHDMDNSEVYSHQPVGNYNRPVKEGNYDVTFSAFGYYDQSFNIDIVDYGLQILDVELLPVGTLISQFSSSATIAGPGSEINFYDHSLGNNIVSWEWTFEGGIPESSTEINPENIVYDNIGEFDVTLKITDGSGDTDILIMENYISIKEAVVIENTTVTICDGVFYDTGMENSDYSDNEDLVITFYPEIQNMQVILDFIEFDIENHFYCENDYLEIYDGEDVTAPLLGSWCGNDNPGMVYASNDAGALTVLFHSNSSIVESGWKAVISCDSNVGIINNYEPDINIFPNPANDWINIKGENSLQNIVMKDLTGRTVYSAYELLQEHQINTVRLSSGIYTLIIGDSKGRSIRKMQITK